MWELANVSWPEMGKNGHPSSHMWSIYIWPTTCTAIELKTLQCWTRQAKLKAWLVASCNCLAVLLTGFEAKSPSSFQALCLQSLIQHYWTPSTVFCHKGLFLLDLLSKLLTVAKILTLHCRHCITIHGSWIRHDSETINLKASMDYTKIWFVTMCNEPTASPLEVKPWFQCGRWHDAIFPHQLYRLPLALKQPQV